MTRSIETPKPSDGIPTAIYWLALGAFAIGTEGFMISPLLPGMATDFGVSIQAAGQLVTAFALAYGVSSPVLTALTGGFNRRMLLLCAIAAFAVSNLLAACAPGFWGLMCARILLALSAGLFVPGANALAGAIVAPERRGRAIAVVNGGITVAIALGVPLGGLVGHHLGWRMTFVGVAALASIATAGVWLGVPRDIGRGLPVATLSERLAVAARPAVLMTLLSTTLWATGAYTVYTYLSPLLTSVAGLSGAEISGVLFLWGISAAIGVVSGGLLSDRVGPLKVIVPAITLMAVAFASLGVSQSLLSPTAAVAPVLAAVVIWGLAQWAFYPAQQARLIEIGGISVAPIVLSLNASFMYIGFSLGAALGGATLVRAGVGGLGWVAAACEVVAVGVTCVLALSLRRSRAAAVRSGALDLLLKDQAVRQIDPHSTSTQPRANAIHPGAGAR
jgi:predicted MFS family arabinose efflux permease